MIRLASLLLLAACAAPAALAPDRTAARDPGGSVLMRAAEIASLRARGVEKRIAGTCDSACTMYLGLPTACFEEGAVLGFHGPRLVGGLAMSDAQFDALTGYMASFYPPRLAAWYMAEARHSQRIVKVPAAELVARGEARACPG